MARVPSRADQVGLVVGLHQATAVGAQALGTDAGARLTGHQLDAVSEVDDSAGCAGNYANEGGGDGRVLHLEAGLVWEVKGKDDWSRGLVSSR